MSCFSHGTRSSSASVATPTIAACCRKNTASACGIGGREAAAQHAGELVAPRGGEEPHAEDEPDEALGRQPRHGAEADRAQSNSSPTVCRKNSPTSHSGLTRPSAVSIAAGTMSRNDRPRKNSPNANFAGLDG